MKSLLSSEGAIIQSLETKYLRTNHHQRRVENFGPVSVQQNAMNTFKTY
jgi:hypothetical protein